MPLACRPWNGTDDQRRQQNRRRPRQAEMSDVMGSQAKPSHPQHLMRLCVSVSEHWIARERKKINIYIKNEILDIESINQEIN
jgi:hypothetical protein